MTSVEYAIVVRATLSLACNNNEKLFKFLWQVFIEAQMNARESGDVASWVGYSADDWCKFLEVDWAQFLALAGLLKKKGLVEWSEEAQKPRHHHLFRPTQKAIRLAAVDQGTWRHVLWFLPLHPVAEMPCVNFDLGDDDEVAA